MAKDIQFEKALERLDQIVDDLESGEVSLDDSLKKYEEGVKLARSCQQKLAAAEKKIEILSRSLDGDFSAEPFSTDANEEAVDEKPARRRGKAHGESGADEDDLLI